MNAFVLGLLVGVLLVRNAAETDIKAMLPPVHVAFPAYRSNAVYRSPTHKSQSPAVPLRYWYQWEDRFMSVVQPEKPDAGFIAGLQNKSAALLSDTSQILEILKSPQLGGILTLTVLGILYVILMPLAGFIWGCYRCTCYKGVQPYHPDGYGSKRLVLSLLLFVMVVGIFGAAAMSYMTGSDIVRSSDTVDQVLQAALSDTELLLNETEAHIRFTANGGFGAAKMVMMNDLKQTGPIVGGIVLSKLSDVNVTQTILDFVQLSHNATETAATMSDINAKIHKLAADAGKLQDQLTELKESLVDGGDCPDNCAEIDPIAEKLTLNVDFSSFNLDAQVQAGNAVLAGDFSGSVMTGYYSLMNVMTTIQNKTELARLAISDKLDGFDRDIDSYMEGLTNFTEPLSKMIDDQAKQLHGYSGSIQEYGNLTYVVIIVIASVLLVISLLVLCGCICGSAYFDRTVLPTQRHGVMTRGGCLLMSLLVVGPMLLHHDNSTSGFFCDDNVEVALAGTMIRTARASAACTGPVFPRFFRAVFFILLLAWLLMLLVVVLFVASTQMDGVLCPLLQGAENNFTLLDQVMEHVENTTNNGQPLLRLFGNSSLDPAVIMVDCMNNKSLYSVLNLGSVFDLDELQTRLNSFDIRQTMNGLSVYIGDIEIFSASSESLANKFISSLSANFDSFTPELRTNKSLTVANLTVLREVITHSTGTDDYVHRNLVQIDEIQNGVKQTVEDERAALLVQITAFQLVAQSLTRTTQNLITEAKHSQAFMAQNASEFVTEAASAFSDQLYGIAEEFVDYAVTTIRRDVGSCRPLYDAVDGVTSLLCHGFIPPLNGFWFALGLGLVLFIPVTCCSCSLAKYYQRALLTDAPWSSTVTQPRRVSNPLRALRKVHPLQHPVTVQIAGTARTSSDSIET